MNFGLSWNFNPRWPLKRCWMQYLSVSNIRDPGVPVWISAIGMEPTGLYLARWAWNLSNGVSVDLAQDYRDIFIQFLGMKTYATFLHACFLFGFLLWEDLMLLRHLGMIVSWLAHVFLWSQDSELTSSTAFRNTVGSLRFPYDCIFLGGIFFENSKITVIDLDSWFWENLVVKELSKSQVFQFFPDLPLIDFCIFNASGWDRIKERAAGCWSEGEVFVKCWQKLETMKVKWSSHGNWELSSYEFKIVFVLRETSKAIFLVTCLITSQSRASGFRFGRDDGSWRGRGLCLFL